MSEISAAVEALLFVADSPMTAEELALLLEKPPYAVEEAIEALKNRLEGSGGLQLVQIAGGYQLSTKPEFCEAVKKLVRPQQQRLSRSALETLAIVAYRQPVTAAEVDQIRGVQSDHSLRLLVERRMIAQTGRKSTPGRPIVYGTTQAFLHAFGLESLAALPDLAEDEQPVALGIEGA